MTVDTKTQDTAQFTTALPLSATQALNWKNCWYPVAFLQDLPKDRPYSFSLYDEPLVLFRTQDGKLACLIDRCPHRAAKLSDGQIIDGQLECLYHGWQFGTEGQCLHIPQLAAEAKIPAQVCVPSFKVVERQGMIWMWRGETDVADEDRIPTLATLDQPGLVHSDLMLDLPYDQTYLLENLLDPAHAPISHQGTKGGGSGKGKKDAQPLEMEVIECSIQGILGRFRETRKPNSPWINLDFIAPNLVFLHFTIEKRGWSFGLAFYSLPLGKGRCRVLSRSYRNFFTWQAKIKPRWLIHLNQNKIFDEDLPLIVGQQAQIEQSRQNLKDLYLPLKTSDLFVIEYRKWLDQFGQSLPFYQGYFTSKGADETPICHQNPVQIDRFLRHTQLCSSCNGAYQITKRLKQSSIAIAIALGTLAILTDSSWGQIMALSLSLSALALAGVAQIVKTQFERPYTRQ